MNPDPDEETWLADRRRQASEYLTRHGIIHGRIGESPAWFVFPHITLWAIESAKTPGMVGWWLICGDCPTDYVKCTGNRTPRSAIESISSRWQTLSASLARGEQHPDFTVGNPANALELAPLLASRADFLAAFALDDSIWEARP